LKILVAEDEEGIALTYELGLRARGHEVTITTNGKHCVQEYESNLRSLPQHSGFPFDVVILDYRMPEMDGYEAAKRILKMNPDQRIIFASAFGKEVLEGLIRKVGIIAEILQKPFELDILTDTVEDSFIYTQLQSLKVNVGDLKTWNPSHQQISYLLDALLRLRDPRTVFAKLNSHDITADPNEAIEKTRTLHAAVPKNEGKADDSKIIAGIIEEALRYLGPDWMSIFFYHLASLGIQKQEIADKPEQFVEALDKVLGSASALVKMQILQAIESSQEVIGTSTTITEFKAKISEMSCITSNNNIGGNAK
jgi:CheY-like chemotaxis protein